MGVCVSGCVCVMPVTDMLTPLSWNPWEELNLRSCNTTRRRSIHGAEGIQVSLRRPASQTQLFQTRLQHRERHRSSIYWGNFTCTGHISTSFPLFLFGAPWSRCFTQSFFLTFSPVFKRLLLQCSNSDRRLSSRPFKVTDIKKRNGQQPW